ncbi:MAG: MBL fold metallo-hydrolase [Clostridia bacterium]|nr:MBL fold metallo-hydrolase [Clostridia bacterium]
MSYGFVIKWLSVSSFELRFDGFTVVTDPYITECETNDLTWEAVEACDAICLTHVHWDHITDIPRLVEKFSPKILCGEMSALPMVRWLDCNPLLVYPMPANTELDYGKVKIRALYGHHGNLKNNWNALMDRVKNHPLCQKDPKMAEMQEAGTLEYRNWLFTLPGGARMVLWGGPATIEHINACKALAPDVLILQRPSSEADIQAKLDFAKAAGCKVLIPHHQEFRSKEKPEVVLRWGELFEKEVPGAKFIYPNHGEWIKL